MTKGTRIFNLTHSLFIASLLPIMSDRANQRVECPYVKKMFGSTIFRTIPEPRCPGDNRPQQEKTRIEHIRRWLAVAQAQLILRSRPLSWGPQECPGFNCAIEWCSHQYDRHTGTECPKGCHPYLRQIVSLKAVLWSVNPCAVTGMTVIQHDHLFLWPVERFWSFSSFIPSGNCSFNSGHHLLALEIILLVFSWSPVIPYTVEVVQFPPNNGLYEGSDNYFYTIDNWLHKTAGQCRRVNEPPSRAGEAKRLCPLAFGASLPVNAGINFEHMIPMML